MSYTLHLSICLNLRSDSINIATAVKKKIEFRFDLTAEITLRAIDGHAWAGSQRPTKWLLGKVLEAYNEMLDPVVDTGDLRTLHNIGCVYGYQCRFVEAENVYRKAWGGRARVLGADKPGTLTAMHSLALVLEHSERLAEAEELCVKVLETRIKAP